MSRRTFASAYNGRSDGGVDACVNARVAPFCVTKESFLPSLLAHSLSHKSNRSNAECGGGGGGDEEEEANARNLKEEGR